MSAPHHPCNPRILVPLPENHQLTDGDVALPAALRPYLSAAETLRGLPPLA